MRKILLMKPSSTRMTHRFKVSIGCTSRRLFTSNIDPEHTGHFEVGKPLDCATDCTERQSSLAYKFWHSSYVMIPYVHQGRGCKFKSWSELSAGFLADVCILAYCCLIPRHWSNHKVACGSGRLLQDCQQSLEMSILGNIISCVWLKLKAKYDYLCNRENPGRAQHKRQMSWSFI